VRFPVSYGSTIRFRRRSANVRKFKALFENHGGIKKFDAATLGQLNDPRGRRKACDSAAPEGAALSGAPSDCNSEHLDGLKAHPLIKTRAATSEALPTRLMPTFYLADPPVLSILDHKLVRQRIEKRAPYEIRPPTAALATQLPLRCRRKLAGE